MTIKHKQPRPSGISDRAPLLSGMSLRVLSLAIAAALAAPLAHAEETVCARVKIEIKQELTLERQGFEAEMKINNATDASVIENVAVAVKVTEEDGTPVAVTGDPNDLGARFFLRLSDKQNISDVDGTGTVNPQTSAIIDWQLIPAPGAAGTSPLGKKYLVGATLTYTYAGERTVLEVSPDVITVKPLPLLTLDYFLPRDVWADDPLTPEIEATEPFTLGVRVKNTGHADAKSLKIDSAQPKIVENNQGLLINFLLTGSYVDDAPARNSLLLDFGDLPADTAKMGRWNMETTLAGQFVEFTAQFTHGDELGGALTSLMQAVNTHTLIHDVRADLPGRDTVRDFLAQDGDTVRLYESDSADSDVTDRSATASLAAGTDARYRLSLPATQGFVYVKLPDPFQGQKVLGNVVRSDAKKLAAENVWLSKTRNQETKQWQYWVNVFDANTPGQYDAQFQDPASIPQPPVLQFIPDRTAQETQQVSFLVEASSANGQPPTLSAAPLPEGATLTPQAGDPAAPGLARAIFDWTPPHGLVGDYPITFTAAANGLSATRTAKITVQTATLGQTPPEANSDRATTRQAVGVTLAILANDSLGIGAANFDLASLDLDPSTPAPDATRTLPGIGSFTVNPAGTVHFEPLPSFTGVGTITYRIKDDLGQASNPANLTVTVTGPGNPTGVYITDQPAANPDEATTQPGAIATLDAKLNDVAGAGATLDAATLDLDPGTDGLQTTRTTPAGVWHGNGDGTVSFTPATGFGGVASTPYAIADNAGKTAESTLAVTVVGGTAALAQNDSAATDPATPVTLSVLNNDSASVGAQRVPYALDLDPTTPDQVDTTLTTAEGVWTTQPQGTVSFAPSADYRGSGRPYTGSVTLPYAMTDSLGLSATAEITIAVNPSQDQGAPQAVDDSADTPFQIPVTLTPIANDTASSGAVLNPATLDLDPATAALEQSQATADGTWRIESGQTVSFAPAASFAGPSTLTYRVRDSLGHYADGKLTVTVAGPNGLTLSGVVFHDLNRDQIQDTSEPGTHAGGLHVTALKNGQAVASTPVNPDGGYSLPVAANTAYTLVLSTTANGAVPDLPTGWSHTGETTQGTPDATADGRLNANVGVINLTEQSFGVVGADPVAHDDTATTPHGEAVTVDVLANDTRGVGGTGFDPATLDPTRHPRHRGRPGGTQRQR